MLFPRTTVLDPRRKHQALGCSCTIIEELLWVESYSTILRKLHISSFAWLLPLWSSEHFMEKYDENFSLWYIFQQKSILQQPCLIKWCNGLRRLSRLWWSLYHFYSFSFHWLLCDHYSTDDLFGTKSGINLLFLLLSMLDELVFYPFCCEVTLTTNPIITPCLGSCLWGQGPRWLPKSSISSGGLEMASLTICKKTGRVCKGSILIVNGIIMLTQSWFDLVGNTSLPDDYHLCIEP